MNLSALAGWSDKAQIEPSGAAAINVPVPGIGCQFAGPIASMGLTVLMGVISGLAIGATGICAGETDCRVAGIANDVLGVTPCPAHDVTNAIAAMPASRRYARLFKNPVMLIFPQLKRLHRD